jgi:hypothetical protein
MLLFGGAPRVERLQRADAGKMKNAAKPFGAPRRLVKNLFGFLCGSFSNQIAGRAYYSNSK